MDLVLATKLTAVETSKDVKTLELEEDDDHDHEEKKDDHDHHHDHGGTDHVWLSPLNAKIQMKNICDVSRRTLEHKSEYAANLDKQTQTLICLIVSLQGFTT